MGQPLPFLSLSFWGHPHPKAIPLSNLPVSSLYHWLLIYFFLPPESALMGWTVKRYCWLSLCLFFLLENMACIRCSSRLPPNPVNSLEEAHAVSPVQSLKSPCILQVSQSSAVCNVYFLYISREKEVQEVIRMRKWSSGTNLDIFL